MRVLAVTLVVLALAATAVASPSAGGETALRIAFWTDGAKPGTRVVRSLRCDPVGGTHPRPAQACRELARLGAATLRPVPPGKACTELYGGPQLLLVTGRVGGDPVWVRLRRDNGCEIDRWERNRFLVPTATGR